MEIANILGEQFHKASSDIQYHETTNRKSHLISLNTNNQNPINSAFTQSELQTVLANCRISAAGPDNIASIFLKRLSTKAQDTLLTIFNHLWQQRKFSDIWRRAITLPILKPGKTPTNALSYRPISLTCTLCKLFEKLVNTGILWYLADKSYLHKAQSGFRPNRLTLDSLLVLHTEVCRAFTNHQNLISIFVDQEKAFDTVWRYRILKQLSEWKIGGKMQNFLHNFLPHRTFQVKLHNTCCRPFPQINGIPQGYVLRFTLYLVAINNLSKIFSKPVMTSLYADVISYFL